MKVLQVLGIVSLKRSFNFVRISKDLSIPSSEPTSSESELDRHFRLAFDYETAGDFEKAIFHYQNAAQLSQCDCDRLHAQAGEKAAKEAQDLWEKEGMAAKPTQYFWGRLQQLTETLPCVEISYE